MPVTLLALETATPVCSVALAQDDRVVVDLSLVRPRAHAAHLVPMIRDVLLRADLEPSALDVVAVSAGPGSYTGLRIGASTAKGLALAADAALVAVPSLDAQAAPVLPLTAAGDVVCACFPSRRGEVYAAVYRGGSETETPVALAAAAALATTDLPDWLPPCEGRLWLTGNGAPTVRAALDAAGRREGRILDPVRFRVSAAWVARLAVPRIAAGAFEDVSSFEPAYLKSFVAKKPEGSIFEKLSF